MKNRGLEGVWELLGATLRQKISQKLSWLILVNFGRARRWPKPDHPLRGGGGYPMRCARQAATCLNLRQGGHEELKERLQNKFENDIQNRSRNHGNWSPRGYPGPIRRSSGWSWEVWERFLRFLTRFGGDFWRSWGEADGPKMGQVGSKLRPRWAMIAPI